MSDELKPKIPSEKEAIENDAALFAGEYKVFGKALRLSGVEVGNVAEALLFVEFNRWRKDKS